MERKKSHFEVAVAIVAKLHEVGYIAYFAGGYVRDFLMNHPSDDIDIATTATPQEIQRLFPKTIPVGINFGIVIVVEEGQQFEIATFRKDQGYKDGRRPIGIEPATPEEDAQRRDFTINGMFYDPLQKKLYDYVGGVDDLDKHTIRAIGNPHERFLEDRLRMIRAVRYACRFHFKIEAETVKAILDHADALFPAVAIERIWNEFTKMASFPNFDYTLNSLHRLGLLSVIFPVLKEVTHEEIAKRTDFIPFFPKEAPVIAKILELFPNTPLEEKEKLCSYLKLSNKDLHFVRYYHEAQEIFLNKKSPDLYDWAHFYAHSHFPLCLKIAAIHYPLEKRQTFLQEHHMRYNQLKKAIERMQNKIPFLTAEDLRKTGIPDGPQMGFLLKEGERIAVNQNLNSAEEIIKNLNRPLA